jgi:DNA-binding NtrC family response regulator
MSNVVVLLEDDFDLAALVTELLQDAGYEVVHVTNVDDMLSEAVLRSPCVALVDGMSPTEFDLWWIGPKLAALGVPPVAFTAHFGAVAEFEADRHGFVGVISKPFDADEFVRLVGAICWEDHQATAC